jgi:hypothetical protein
MGPFTHELFDYVQTSRRLPLHEQTSRRGVFHGSFLSPSPSSERFISYTLENEILLESGEKTLVNIGSVGQPRIQSGASYAISTRRPGRSGSGEWHTTSMRQRLPSGKRSSRRSSASGSSTAADLLCCFRESSRGAARSGMAGRPRRRPAAPTRQAR